MAFPAAVCLIYANAIRGYLLASGKSSGTAKEREDKK